MNRFSGSRTVARLLPAFRRLAAAACLVFALPQFSCGDDDYAYYDQCRFSPGLCAGGLGALCAANIDCALGFCCREPKECGGGMCTLSCRNDYDCPATMACEHDKCFFACSTDFDCAQGQHCGHRQRVCEW